MPESNSHNKSRNARREKPQAAPGGNPKSEKTASGPSGDERKRYNAFKASESRKRKKESVAHLESRLGGEKDQRLIKLRLRVEELKRMRQKIRNLELDAEQTRTTGAANDQSGSLDNANRVQQLRRKANCQISRDSKVEYEKALEDFAQGVSAGLEQSVEDAKHKLAILWEMRFPRARAQFPSENQAQKIARSSQIVRSKLDGSMLAGQKPEVDESTVVDPTGYDHEICPLHQNPGLYGFLDTTPSLDGNGASATAGQPQPVPFYTTSQRSNLSANPGQLNKLVPCNRQSPPRRSPSPNFIDNCFDFDQFYRDQKAKERTSSRSLPERSRGVHPKNRSDS